MLICEEACVWMVKHTFIWALPRCARASLMLYLVANAVRALLAFLEFMPRVYPTDCLVTPSSPVGACQQFQGQNCAALRTPTCFLTSCARPVRQGSALPWIESAACGMILAQWKCPDGHAVVSSNASPNITCLQEPPHDLPIQAKLGNDFCVLLLLFIFIVRHNSQCLQSCIQRSVFCS